MNKTYLTRIVKGALAEDLPGGDLTASFFKGMFGGIRAHIAAKAEGVLCGTEIAGAVFKACDRHIRWRPLKRDGDFVKKNERIAIVEGNAEAIVAGERTALNFLMQLSGISTLTRAFVNAIEGTKAIIMDTRKNHPFLREAEKYAVRIVGGYNHRRNLSEGVLIKENYLKGTRIKRDGRVDALKLSRIFEAMRRSGRRIIAEVESFAEFRAVVALRPAVVMLDNFSLSMIRKAVAYRNEAFPSVAIEVSGGVDLKNVRSIARSGVEYISIGSLTHSYRSLDFSLEIE